MSADGSVAGGVGAHGAQHHTRARLAHVAADLRIPPTERLTEQRRAYTLNILGGLFDTIEGLLVRLLAVSLAAAGPSGRAAALDLGKGAVGTIWARVSAAVMAPPFALLDAALVRAGEHVISAPLRAAAEGEGVLARLLASHPDAELSQRVMDLIVAQSTRFDGFGEPRLAFEALDEKEATDAAWLAGAAFASLLLERHPLEEAALDSAIEQAVRQILAEREGRSPLRVASRLCARLAALDALDAAAVGTAVQEGQLVFAAAALGRLAALDPAAALRTLCVGTLHEQQLLLRALDLPTDLARSILDAIGGAASIDAALLEDVSLADARRWLARQRRDTRYSGAIEALAG